MKSFTFKGAAARQRREGLGLRARDVAEEVGITAGHLLNLERGQFEPSAPVYIRICRALDVDPVELRDLLAPEPDTDVRAGAA